VRAPAGGGIKGGLYHSQSPEAYFAHTPGLRVVFPSNPYQAKGLLLAALESRDPVIFFEPKRLYRASRGEVPEEYYTVPLDHALVARRGTDATVVAWGSMLPLALEAAALAEGEGYDVEVIDLVSAAPYDVDALVRSVERTGRMLVVHEAPGSGGRGGELIAAVQERAFTQLEAPLRRLTGFDTPFPYALENHYLPTPDRILFELQELIEY